MILLFMIPELPRWLKRKWWWFTIIQIILPTTYIALVITAFYFLSIRNYQWILNGLLALTLPIIMIVWSNKLKWNRTKFSNSPWWLKVIYKIFLTVLIVFFARFAINDLDGPKTYQGSCKIKFTQGRGSSDEIVFTKNGRTQHISTSYGEFKYLADLSKPADKNLYYPCNSKIQLVYFSAFQKYIILKKI